MTAVGMFGKIPSFGDFVRVHNGSPVQRGFERWLEDSNDVLAECRQQLSTQPLGFVVRDEDTASMLVGIIVGSHDRVGRTFPLGLFYQVQERDLCVCGLPLAMTSELHRLAVVARRAQTRSHADVDQLVRSVPPPAEPDLAARSHAELHRLRIVKAATLFRRVYGEGNAPHFGHAVMLRACAPTGRRSASLPLVLEGRVHTDVELMFALANVQVMSEGRQPGVALWAVRSHRVLMALGRPDPRLLGLMLDEQRPARLWPMSTDRVDVAERARDQLDARQCALLDDVGSRSAKDFLDAMADTCPSHRQWTGLSNERRRPWRKKAP
ncbi:MAG: type VI secretion system-associated protein TagF [Deltaproteobacteria bacterium]|nr:type VI secretion system-associated protein TagF [Deltaproteobacteria bacterium]